MYMNMYNVYEQQQRVQTELSYWEGFIIYLNVVHINFVQNIDIIRANINNLKIYIC